MVDPKPSSPVLVSLFALRLLFYCFHPVPCLFAYSICSPPVYLVHAFHLKLNEFIVLASPDPESRLVHEMSCACFCSVLELLQTFSLLPCRQQYLTRSPRAYTTAMSSSLCHLSGSSTTRPGEHRCLFCL